ncbi:MAG: tetratricopeptide repeat protein [Terriglobales bacterium]
MRVRDGLGFRLFRTAAVLLASCLALPAATAFPIPPPPQSPLQHAHDLVEWGRLKQARALLQPLAGDPGNDKNAALLAYLGHLQVLFGNLKAARELTGKAVRLDPACASCHLYRFEALARNAERLNQFRALLALHGIKDQLEKAARLDPSLGDIQWGWIQLDLTLPPALGGGSQDALQHADLLARLDPVDGNLARAEIFLASGHPQRALAEYRAAAQTHPADPRGVFALGRALYLRADYAGAAAPLRRAWQMNSASALYGAYHAANLTRLQHLRRARAVLASAQRLHPGSRLGDFLTAQALLATGQDLAWARHLLLRYLAVPPEPGQASAASAQQLLTQLHSPSSAGPRPHR